MKRGITTERLMSIVYRTGWHHSPRIAGRYVIRCLPLGLVLRSRIMRMGHNSMYGFRRVGSRQSAVGRVGTCISAADCKSNFAKFRNMRLRIILHGGQESYIRIPKSDTEWGWLSSGATSEQVEEVEKVGGPAVPAHFWGDCEIRQIQTAVPTSGL